jgi:hypothetical protein
LYDGYIVKLKTEFLKLELTTIEGRTRLVNDCNYLANTLGNLKNSEFPPNVLQEFVTESVIIKKSSSRASSSSLATNADKKTTAAASTRSAFSFAKMLRPQNQQQS